MINPVVNYYELQLQRGQLTDRVPNISDRTKLSPSKLYKLVASGDLLGIKHGRAILIDVRSIIDYFTRFKPV